LLAKRVQGRDQRRQISREASKSDVSTAKSQSESCSCVPRDREPANPTLVTAEWPASTPIATVTK
jgi:hypothetical protein